MKAKRKQKPPTKESLRKFDDIGFLGTGQPLSEKDHKIFKEAIEKRKVDRRKRKAA